MDERTALENTLAGHSLPVEEARALLLRVLDGRTDPIWLGGWLVALRAKGETVEEIEGFARAMRERATAVEVGSEGLVDTCGTGGDGGHTFNVSTASAFVAAAAGARVAKHGNRAVSSRCGSADVLEALGGVLDQSPERVAAAIDEVGIGFLFAPAHHGAMRHAAPTRRALRIRTVFNLLGPLTNPARAPHQLVGVFSEDWLEPVAHVLRCLGNGRSLVVHGRDGLDEISVCAPTDALLLHEDGRLERRVLEPEALGVGRWPAAALSGGAPEENARLLRRIFAGEEGAHADIVSLNAGAALWAAGVRPSLEEGVATAREVLRSGAAAERLDAWVAFTRSASE